jgi:general stress protein CsbA
MTLRNAKSDRDVRTRSTAFFRVDLGTRYVTICLVSLVAGRSGEKRYTMCAWSADCGGGRETRLAASRVDLETRYVTICLVLLVAGRSGEKRYTMGCMERGLWGGG